jgi:hypothetical protein
VKLKFQPDLPNERLSLSLPGTVAESLRLFQRYLREEGGIDRDLKQIATAILENFLQAGDLKFVAWKRTEKAKKEDGKPV